MGEAFEDTELPSEGSLRMQHDQWKQLPDMKQWSRLLYTNPVCFLCISSGATHNVMVLSWLTATNNSGQFVFSMNRRRHTASLLVCRGKNDDSSSATPSSGRLFTLSVPVQGMEDLVRSVGQVSGSWVNKFGSASSTTGNEGIGDVNPCHSQSPLSRRRKKKLLLENGANGIPGLTAIPPNSISSVSSDGGTLLICIDGTVAHMVCRVQQILDTTTGNDDHWIVLAQIEAASVHPSYWDAEKNLFRPCRGMPTYLTFFGSQTFGYVVTADQTEQLSNVDGTNMPADKSEG